MRKFRKDAKPVSIQLASKLYWEGGTLRQVANLFHIDKSNLMARFNRFNIPIKSKTYACTGTHKLNGKLHKNWKGGWSCRIQDGRVVNNKTKQYMSRKIGSEILGRPLKTNEVVHHIDLNPSNNDYSNLLICSSSYHGWLHAKMNNFRIGKHYKLTRSN